MLLSIMYHDNDPLSGNTGLVKLGCVSGGLVGWDRGPYPGPSRHRRSRRLLAFSTPTKTPATQAIVIHEVSGVEWFDNETTLTPSVACVCVNDFLVY